MQLTRPEPALPSRSLGLNLGFLSARGVGAEPVPDIVGMNANRADGSCRSCCRRGRRFRGRQIAHLTAAIDISQVEAWCDCD